MTADDTRHDMIKYCMQGAEGVTQFMDSRPIQASVHTKYKRKYSQLRADEPPHANAGHMHELHERLRAMLNDTSS
jgi:hypothetical protein